MPPHPGVDIDAYLPRFGLKSFRPGQREVIATVLAARDCLCVMPTGGGKSLCYQLPAVVLQGLTLVVSPLIALMKDQVDQLQALGVPVTFINSTLSLAEQYDRLDRVAAGQYQLVYVVPERFRSARFLEAVRAVGLKLLAIDEAHCISEWGHDFRPDYARLGKFRHMLGRPTTIALTATATDAVRRDIVEQLDLNEPRTFITGFARPNLFYEVEQARGERQKIDMLMGFLDETPGTGIIYTSSRKKAGEVAKTIAEETRRTAVVYHAGLLNEQRHTAQEDWMSGRAEIVVATNAFGMGIDKPDVRFVVHYNMPGTLEAYYQEAGRAGRDGNRSRCMLLYFASDRFIQEYFIESAYPARENVAAVYGFLAGLEEDPIERTQTEIKEALELPIGAEGVGSCEKILESAGVLERLISSQNLASVRLDSDLPTLVDLLPRQATVRRKVLRAVEKLVGPRRNEMVQFRPRELADAAELDPDSIANALRELNQLDVFTYVPPFRGRAIRMLKRDPPFEQLDIDFETLERRKQAEYDKLQRVVQFALSPRCRQQQILHYFGDTEQGPCGHCDNCAKARRKPRRAAARPAVNGKVVEAVRMALSGVARASARIPCGKNLVAQMLCGSENKRLTRFGFHRLSTFGLLKHLKQGDVVSLLDGLLAIGLLKQEEIDSNRPVVQLTDAGNEVMKGKAELPGELPIPDELLVRLGGAVRATRPPRDDERDARETEDRSAVRPRPKPLPEREGTKRRSPRPEAHLPEREGTKLPSPLPKEAERPHPSPLPKGEGTAAGKGVQPAHYWTWRLLSAGFPADECMAIRGLSREVVLDHALRALEEGWPVRPEACLSAELIAALDRVVGSALPTEIRPLLAHLPVGTGYQEVQLFLKCRQQRPVP